MFRSTVILLLTLAMFGCRKDRFGGDSNDSSGLMGIDAQTADLTKAYQVTNSATMRSVGLIGVATGQGYWSDLDFAGITLDENNPILRVPNLRMNYDESKDDWSYADQTASWQNPFLTDKFSFFAYSPYMYESCDIGDEDNYYPALYPTYRGVDYPTLSYHCPDFYAYQRDVLIAEQMIDIYRPSNNHVSLIFHHALTCVGFQVRECVPLKYTPDGQSNSVILKRRIKSIAITGVAAKGVAQMDGRNMSWIVDKSDTKKKVFVAGFNQKDEESQAYPLELKGIRDPYSTDFMNPDGYLMLMPQLLPSSAKILLMVEYDEPTATGVETKTRVYDYNISGLWRPNQRMVYNITIGAEDITSVNVKTYQWEETLIHIGNKEYYLDIDSDRWIGSVMVPGSDFVDGDDAASSGATGGTQDWWGYISPGYQYGPSADGADSSGGGASGYPDRWIGYVVSGSTNMGGEGSASGSGSGTTGNIADKWDGYIESAVGMGGESSGSSSGGGSTGNTADIWDGYIESAVGMGGESGGSSSGGGSTGNTADIWDGYIESAVGMGGESGGSSSGGGSTGENANIWDGYIESAAGMGGEGNTEGSGGGSSGNSADIWDGYIESAVGVGGESNTEGSGGGSTGSAADRWDGYIESAVGMGGESNTEGSGGGSSGNKADGWQGGTETEGSLDVNDGKLDVNSGSNTDQWGGNSTIVGGGNTSTSGLVDTTIESN